MKRHLLSLALVLSLCAGLAVPCAAVSFSDVPDGHWGAAAISQAAERGIMKGDGSGRFLPDASLTGEQFIAMLIRRFYPQLGIGDGPAEAWAGPYIYAAGKVGLLKTVSNDPEFISADPLRRDHMAQIIADLAAGLGRELTAAAVGTIPDAGDVPAAYLDAVCACYGSGILQGVDEVGTFLPAGTMNRASAAVVLVRLEALLGA